MSLPALFLSLNVPFKPPAVEWMADDIKKKVTYYIQFKPSLKSLFTEKAHAALSMKQDSGRQSRCFYTHLAEFSVSAVNCP